MKLNRVAISGALIAGAMMIGCSKTEDLSVSNPAGAPEGAPVAENNTAPTAGGNQQVLVNLNVKGMT